MPNKKDPPKGEPPINQTLRAADTEAILSAIVESSDDAIISKDLDGIITSWNRGAEVLFGYSAEEAIGKPVDMLIPANRKDEEPKILARIRRGEKVDHFETVRQRKDGSLVEISLTISPIRNTEGKIVGASKIARNISERKFASRQMARLVAIVESSDDAIISKDLNGVITSWNKGAEKLFGYTAEEAIGESVTMLIPRDRIDEEPEILARIRSGAKIDHYETIRRRKDGRLINIALTVSPIFDAGGEVVGASKIARDISDRLAAESDRREKEMMRRLLDAEEAEANRIARDLHDHLGQKMTALRLKLENLFQNIGPNSDIETMIAEIREIASGIDEEMNFLSWELRPTELEHVGIEAAMRSYIKEWSKHYGIRAEFHSETRDDIGGRIHPNTETNLYRFLQEALNNVLKHAEAGFVDVMYVNQDGEIVLAIEDDGKGFDAEGVAPFGGSKRRLGLTAMHERIALLDGTLDIESIPGDGTKLFVRVPVVPADPDNGHETNGNGHHSDETHENGGS